MQLAVALARREGFDWGRIGRNLGITRQGARQRFPAAPPALPPHVVRRNRAERATKQANLMAERFLDDRLRGNPSRSRNGDDDDPIAW